MNAKEQDKSLKRSKVAIILGAIILFGILATIIFWAVNANRIKKDTTEQEKMLEQLQEEIDVIDESTVEVQNQLNSLLEKLNSMDEYVNTNKQVVNGINSVSNVSSEFIDSVEKETISLQTVLNKYVKDYSKTTGMANESVANAFEEVNKDINNLVNVINNNNAQQNSNYSSISSQLDKLLKDTKKFIQILTEENVEQHKSLIEKMTGYDETLTKLLETEFAELTEKIVSVDESLDTLSKRIDDARTEILELLESVRVKQVENLQAKYDDINIKIDDLSKAFVETLASVEDTIVELQKADAERYKGVVASLETVNTNLSDLSKNTQSDLKLFKSSMDALIYTFQDNVNTFESTMGELFASASGDINEIATLLANANTDTAKIITDYFVASNQGITEKFASFNQNAADKFNEVEKAENDKIAGIQNDLEAENKVINDTINSVVDGKQLLVEGLKKKNVDTSSLSEVPTFQEIADLIKSIQPTIDPAVLPDIIEITDYYHHHTLGTVGDADSTELTDNLPYADDYRSDVSGGCFTQPVYHEHVGNDKVGGECYTTLPPHVHTGSATPEGVLVENSCYESYSNHEIVGYHKESSPCGGHGVSVRTYERGDSGTPCLNSNEPGHAGAIQHWTVTEYSWTDCSNQTHTVSYHSGSCTGGCSFSYGSTYSSPQSCPGRSWQVADWGYVTRYRTTCGLEAGQIVHELSCGMTEETIIGYDRSCGVLNNQLVSKHLEY